MPAAAINVIVPYIDDIVHYQNTVTFVHIVEGYL